VTPNYTAHKNADAQATTAEASIAATEALSLDAALVGDTVGIAEGIGVLPSVGKLVGETTGELDGDLDGKSVRPSGRLGLLVGA
jgi:hypothetical protein